MITVKVHNACGTIVLDRPARCNALNRDMITELQQAFDDLRQEKKVRGIVISGAGSHFCSGLDVRELHETVAAEDAMQQWFRDTQAIQELLEQMLHCPKPIVAAVDGSAIGTGFAIVLASDLVVASHRGPPPANGRPRPWTPHLPRGCRRLIGRLARRAPTWPPF